MSSAQEVSEVHFPVQGSEPVSYLESSCSGLASGPQKTRMSLMENPGQSLKEQVKTTRRSEDSPSGLSVLDYLDVLENLWPPVIRQTIRAR